MEFGLFNFEIQINRLENGARGSKLDEPLTILRNYAVEWSAARVNLRELALLRFIQGKTERELAQYFGRSKSAIHELLGRMVKNNFKHANLTVKEKYCIDHPVILKFKSVQNHCNNNGLL